jgi:hypothetical protein
MALQVPEENGSLKYQHLLLHLMGCDRYIQLKAIVVNGLRSEEASPRFCTNSSPHITRKVSIDCFV